MSQHHTYNQSSDNATPDIAPLCSLIPGVNGEMQVVYSRPSITVPQGAVLIDLQTVHYDTHGYPRADHSTIRLTVDAAAELLRLLSLIVTDQGVRGHA